MDLVRANFPETLLLAREPVAWGATAEVLTADNLLKARRMCEAFDDSAAACAVDDCRRGRPDRHALRRADRALHRIRVHAPRAGRRARAGARRRADRRVPDAAAHEPGRRRHGACDPAGRGDRLSAVRPQSVRDDGRRTDRGLRGRDSGGRRRAHDRIEGRRLARDLLSGLARARRHHRVASRAPTSICCMCCSATCWRWTTRPCC